MPPKVEPKPRVSESYKPATSTRYQVTSKDSWGSLAASRSIDAWDLIDFNFPGMKALHLKDHEAASRQVNWYLYEYVGCRREEKNNYAFSSGISGGRGVHQGGWIFLPPNKAVVPPTPEQKPRIIDLPSFVSPEIEWLLKQLDVRLPKRARSLDPKEVAFARPYFRDSLAYDDIYITDGKGAGDAEFTCALKLDGRWIVVLNMGEAAFDNPIDGASFRRNIFIHELVHAWQSQHHNNPIQFMVNSVKSRTLATTMTAAMDVARSKRIRQWLPEISVLVPDTITDLGDASNYSYVAGLRFGAYGAEQMAQLLEDLYFPREIKNGPLDSKASANAGNMWAHIRDAKPHQHDVANAEGLSTARIAFENLPNVVWHTFD